MKRRGHYCRVCGEYKANEKFSGKGHASNICKKCSALPLEKRNQQETLTKLSNLPWRLNREQINWLKKKRNDRREAVRDLANAVYDMHFPPRHIEIDLDDDLDDDLGDDLDFDMLLEDE